MGCDSITYSFSLDSSRLNEDELCSRTQNQPNPLMTDFYKKPFPKLFIRQLRKYGKNISADPFENCNQYLKYRAVVLFQLASNDVSVTITSRRLSFFDKLSGFGKKISFSKHFRNCFRWNSRLVHWNEYSEHGGDSFLDSEIFCLQLQQPKVHSPSNNIIVLIKKKKKSMNVNQK